MRWVSWKIAFITCVPVVALATLTGIDLRAEAAAAPTTRTILVPIDRSAAQSRSAALTLDLGAPLDPRKPTVIVVEDGQQFYVRKGAMAALRQSLFGNTVNVVGLVPRGSTDAFVRAALDAEGRPDWRKAWRIFNSNEWIEDIETTRASIAGASGPIYLYGRSGGAYLVHQYLAKYGNRIARAFTQSAVDPQLNRELGIPLDTFWDELGHQDASLQPKLLQALRRAPNDRTAILLALQRQHFFVAPADLPAARAKLITTLARGDRRTLQADRKAYQVDDVLRRASSNDIIPQDVRVVELLYPAGAFDEARKPGVHPLTQSQSYFTKPLLDLIGARAIAAPAFSLAPAHTTQTEVFVLAGYEDEAIDYRTSIALAAAYPRHTLFIADDNHVFERLVKAHQDRAIVQSFFRYGLESPELQRTLNAAAPYRWSPKP
jgi:hypothetical protein